MNTSQVKESLQDLIFRLQDAEKGYKEIEKATANLSLKKWLKTYSYERHNFHKELEGFMLELGGNPEVETTFLGELHRMFIDVKINNIENDFNPIVNEIERGSNILINDYEKVLSEIAMPVKISTALRTQKAVIQKEVKELVKLKEEFEAEKV